MEPALKITSVLASAALESRVSLVSFILEGGRYLQGLDTGVFDETAPKPAHTLDDDGAQHDGDGRYATFRKRVLAS